MHIPPCARNESLSSAVDFVIMIMFLSSGRLSVAYIPATPVPAITISALIFFRFELFCIIISILQTIVLMSAYFASSSILSSDARALSFKSLSRKISFLPVFKTSSIFSRVTFFIFTHVGSPTV